MGKQGCNGFGNECWILLKMGQTLIEVDMHVTGPILNNKQLPFSASFIRRGSQRTYIFGDAGCSDDDKIFISPQRKEQMAQKPSGEENGVKLSDRQQLRGLNNTGNGPPQMRQCIKTRLKVIDHAEAGRSMNNLIKKISRKRGRKQQ